MTVSAHTLSVEFRSRPCAGEELSGDEAIVRVDKERSLVAVVDALGHGPRAHEVASVAARFLHSCAIAVDPVDVLHGLDRALAGTRGAAATICVHDGETVRCAGVGNVELRSIGTRVGLIPSPGVLGRRPRRVRSTNYRVSSGDRIALFSDGVSGRIHLPEVQGRSLPSACSELFDRYAQEGDDATLVLYDVLDTREHP